MRKLFSLSVGFFFFISAYAQDGTFSSLPSVSVKDLKGNTLSSSSFDNNGKPIIISFWATWCKPCIEELNAINDMYVDWVDETGVKLIAVSIDDARNAARVRPFVLGKGWEYEIYLDENSDLRRALNVNNPPHTFLLNGNKEIVWQHNGYVPGDEDVLFELVKKLSAGLPIK
jgi:cytochrome c biogenesis protein CcmG, thiol:disulfide interchange protein DsbE